MRHHVPITNLERLSTDRMHTAGEAGDQHLWLLTVSAERTSTSEESMYGNLIMNFSPCPRLLEGGVDELRTCGHKHGTLTH